MRDRARDAAAAFTRRVRHVRHRRRRRGTFNVSTVVGARRRGVRRAGGEARQPIGVEPVRQRRPVRGARRQRRRVARDVVDALPRRGGHRVPLRADVPSVDAARGAAAARPRRADGVQPARPADESRRARRASSSGVPRPELTELVARALAPARVDARVGRARRGRPRRDLDARLHEGVRVPRRVRAHLLRAPGGRRRWRRRRPGTSPAAMQRPMPTIARGILAGERARSATSCC